MEDDDVIDTVQELRAEVLLQLGLDLDLHLLVGVAVIVIRSETKVQALGHIARTEVRGHDDDSVLEIYTSAL